MPTLLPTLLRAYLTQAPLVLCVRFLVISVYAAPWITLDHTALGERFALIGRERQRVRPPVLVTYLTSSKASPMCTVDPLDHTQRRPVRSVFTCSVFPCSVYPCSSVSS